MKNLPIFLFTLLVLSWIVGCSSPPMLESRTQTTTIQATSVAPPDANKLDIEVPSLKTRYDEFLQISQEWQEDAYLVKAIIYLTETGGIRYYLDYQSPSSKNYSRAIYEKADGDIVNESVYWDSIEVRQEKPIETIDFIDSPEAMKIFLEDEIIARFLNKTTEHCSFLVLEWKKLPTSEKALIWRLTLSQCGGSSAQHYRILATTGEKIQP